MLPVVHLMTACMVVNGNHEASLGTLTLDMIMVGFFFFEKDIKMQRTGVAMQRGAVGS